MEYQLAWDIQHFFEYAKWDKFLKIDSKSKTAFEVSGHSIENHFPAVRKMVDLGFGSQHDVDNIMPIVMPVAVLILLGI